MQSQTIGAQAEQLAKEFLSQQGLTFIEQNYLCPQGELDLVFKNKQQWVFVEVKNRKNNHFGSAAQAVTHSKQRKLILAAQHYIANQKISPHDAMRFDVIAITNLKANSIEWIENAFMAN